MMPSIWSKSRRSGPRPTGDGDRRNVFEQDYDRLLFSTPVRRLADKTQVFPLEKNDSVRTRLTHSHEVSNLARSLGTRLNRIDSKIFSDDPEIAGSVPVILATTGLAHDLGNPPFGHQGEAAIGRWFEHHMHVFSEHGHSSNPNAFTPVDTSLHGDFLKFEGNAQTIRLVCRLQNTAGEHGLNLTAATLASMMKYTVPSSRVAKGNAASKKFGFFASENDVVEWVRKETGLEEGQRHPLVWLMESCDDTAYAILDIEDAITKGIVSPEDFRAYLASKFKLTESGGGLVNQLNDDFDRASNLNSTPSRTREVKASYIRTRLIERLLTGSANEFARDKAAIFSYSRTAPLLECGNFESDLTQSLKDFAREHAYNSSSVLEVELKGSRVIHSMMDHMWSAINNRSDFLNLGSRRKNPADAFIYSNISESYRWHFENSSLESGVPIRYAELQLLTDMISGMTDRFAVELCAKLARAVDG